MQLTSENWINSIGVKYTSETLSLWYVYTFFISVWNMQTGKCQRTFRHRYPVMAIAMSTETVISGCEGGKVKVWDLRTGNLIKVSYSKVLG